MNTHHSLQRISWIILLLVVASMSCNIDPPAMTPSNTDSDVVLTRYNYTS